MCEMSDPGRQAPILLTPPGLFNNTAPLGESVPGFRGDPGLLGQMLT